MTTDTQKYEQRISRQGNNACYGSAAFFPKRLRDEFFKLYYFMKVVDDYADVMPQQRQAFMDLHLAWDQAKGDKAFDPQPDKRDTVETRTVKNLVHLARECNVDPEWFDTYFVARQADFDSSVEYQTLPDTLAYIHGTAEMIALATCRIMNADPIVYPAVCTGARAVHYLNFIRDTANYNTLNRCYIPKDDLEAFGLSDMRRETAMAHKKAFEKCVRHQLSRCGRWQRMAKEDVCYLPKDCRVSLVTALEMYEWVSATIDSQPFVIFDYKVRPAKHRVLLAGIAHYLNWCE